MPCSPCWKNTARTHARAHTHTYMHTNAHTVHTQAHTSAHTHTHTSILVMQVHRACPRGAHRMAGGPRRLCSVRPPACIDSPRACAARGVPVLARTCPGKLGASECAYVGKLGALSRRFGGLQLRLSRRAGNSTRQLPGAPHVHQPET